MTDILKPTVPQSEVPSAQAESEGNLSPEQQVKSIVDRLGIPKESQEGQIFDRFYDLVLTELSKAPEDRSPATVSTFSTPEMNYMVSMDNAGKVSTQTIPRGEQSGLPQQQKSEETPNQSIDSQVNGVLANLGISRADYGYQIQFDQFLKDIALMLRFNSPGSQAMFTDQSRGISFSVSIDLDKRVSTSKMYKDK